MPDDPNAKQSLVDATRNLYKVFGKHRGQSNWTDCMDVLSPDYESLPARLSVKELNDHDVDYFFSHSGYTMRHDDLVKGVKYFLPRVLAPWVEAENRPPPEMVFSEWFVGTRLREAQWHRWPDHEVQAVQRWLNAWLETIVKYRPMPHDCAYNGPAIPENRRFNSWLELAAEANLGTALLIDRVSQIDAEVAVLLVAACLNRFARTLARKQVLWEAPDPAPQRPLLAWLLAWSTEQRLEQAFFQCGGGEVESWISRELESLRALKAALPSY